jgi:hypothetical protein
MPPADAYNPDTVGNFGSIAVDDSPRGGLETSARLMISANGILVFALE